MENTINNKDDIKIKTICDFLFLDKYKDTATFQRFEECFQPLFNNINISLQEIFKEICGPKKKYITYKRLRRAFLKYINNKNISEDTQIFFEKLFNSILKEEKVCVGKDIENNENIYIFSTKKTGGKSKNLTKIQILTDEEEKINGINLEYDGIYESRMYPKVKEDDLYLSLEVNLKVINKTYNDAVTHIFGTINENGYINFLGFKCISGKNLFIGFPKGEGFLFGKFGTKFHNLKVQITEEGISKFEPIFIENIEINYFLRNISNININVDEIIKEEEKLIDLKEEDDDDDNYDKLLTTSIIEDNFFYEKDLEDKYCGSDYKEIIEQTPRKWISKTIIGRINRIHLNLNESLKLYEKAKLKIKTQINSSNKNNFGKIANKIVFHKKKKLTPRLEIKESFILDENDRKESEMKWDGKLDNNVNIFTFFNKNNYQKLKEQLGKMIHDDFIKKNKDKYNPIQQAILNKLVPFPGSYEKDNEDGNKTLKIENKPKILNTKKFKGEIIEENNIEIANNQEDDDDINRKEIIYSDAAEFYNSIIKEDEKIKNDNFTQLEKNKDLEKCQLNLKLKDLEKKSTYIWQTIGNDFEAQNMLKSRNNLNISNNEQIKVYKRLKENEKIVDSLNDKEENIEIDITPLEQP